MNRTQAKNWFGDRGMYISANNIKVRGRWGLVKEWWSIKDNEVDCYDLAGGSICAEPWDAIKYTDSPFIPRNEEATQRAIAKLDNEYGEELPRRDLPSALCLIAISGDTAVGGMGAENDVLPFGAEHNGLVKTYLDAQLAFHMECAFHRHTPASQKLYMALNSAGNALREVKVFHHKYHLRTTWELAYTDELDVISRYQPFAIKTKENWEPI